MKGKARLGRHDKVRQHKGNVREGKVKTMLSRTRPDKDNAKQVKGNARNGKRQGKGKGKSKQKQG